MGIWKKAIDLEALTASGQGNMTGHLAIEFVAYGEAWLEARMPVNERTIQYMGILHGGASAALAETVGSYAANLVLAEGRAVGLELNINHLRPVRSGFIKARARARHLGKTTQVWEIEIHNEREKLVSLARLTMAVVS